MALRLSISYLTVAWFQIGANPGSGSVKHSISFRKGCWLLRKTKNVGLLFVTNLRIESGRVKFEGRGPWKHVVAAGFTAERVPTPTATGSTESATFPTLCTSPAMVRALFQSITDSFADNPVWV